jgi:hypothetical protein
MSLVLKTRIELSANAVSFKIYDISTGWGTDGDPLSSAIQNAVLVIDSDRYDAVFYDLYGAAGAIWNEFLSSDGHEVLIAGVYPTLSGFPDDYYSCRLVINSDGSALYDANGVIEANVDFSYDNTQGFLAYAREAQRKLPLPLDWDNFDWNENRKIYKIALITDGAEADANQGNITRFKAKMNYVSEQLNLRGIEYIYTFE